MFQFKNLFRAKPGSFLFPWILSKNIKNYAPLINTSAFLTPLPLYNFATYRPKEKLVPTRIPSFQNYGLSADILTTLEAEQINTPTPIQDMVITEFMKSNKHLVFAAQTGTGKTLAYAIPLIQKLKQEEMAAKTLLTQPNRPRAIIFVPNKELVLQTIDVIKDFCHTVKLKAGALSGADPYTREKNMLNEGVDILVTTPDKFDKHYEKKNVFLSQMRYLVIDEMDTFLDAGYGEVINGYMQTGIKLANNPRMVFLSSTFTDKMRRLITVNFGKEGQACKILIDNNLHYNLSNLDHEFLHLQGLDKKEPLLKILKEYESYMKKTKSSTIIFCNTVPSCQSLEYFLKDNGYDCVTLHGDVPKKLRIQNFDRFKRREVDILISSDLGSRGLDFPFVTHVINYDFPKTGSDYLHRAGRAGRAGRKGHVTSFYHQRDFKLIQELKASNEEGRPLQIRGSAFVSFKEKEKEPEPDDGLQKIAKSPELSKYLPEDYINYRRQYEATQKKGPQEPKRVRGFKKAKDINRSEIREIKDKMKLPKAVRSKSSKYLKNLKQKLKKTHDRVRRRRTWQKNKNEKK